MTDKNQSTLIVNTRKNMVTNNRRKKHKKTPTFIKRKKGMWQMGDQLRY